MGKSKRDSPCPGCAVAKSLHSFGRLHKNCEGPPSSSEHEDSEHEIEEIPPVLPSGEGASSKEVLASILSAVEGLNKKVASLQKDHNDLRQSVAEKPSDRVVPTASGGVNRLASRDRIVTLPDLRDMEGLVEQANRRVADFHLGDDASSVASGDASSDQRQSGPTHNGKLKSGKEEKLTSSVLYPQLWPHSHISFTQVARDIRFEDLTMQEFVAGYGQILLSPRISDLEKTSRTRHLISLMCLEHQ
jgi:hypothetical protein